MSQLSLQLLQSIDAVHWMDSKTGGAAWAHLYEECSWRFPTLGIEFCRLWYKHYRDEWEPLLLVATDEKDKPSAILPLAFNANRITGAGAHQAEYQGWLSVDVIAEPFLHAALSKLRQSFPQHAVQLRYLAPGLPQDTVRKACAGNARVQLSTHSRPLLRLDSTAVSKALQKKNTRSKINRLKRLGHLEFGQLADGDTIRESLDAVIALYDLRQGATNDSCPFTDDPRKKPFLLEWLQQQISRDLHFSCLYLDEEMIAAHIGVKTSKECQLAILAHAPRYAAYSPGKIQVYRTAELLTEAGLNFLDLTPGGDPWKERFATDHDTVLSLFADTSTFRARSHRVRSWTERLARALLERLGLSPSQVKSWIQRKHQPKRGSPAPSTPNETTSTRFRIPPDWQSVTSYPESSSSPDPLGELCLYRPGPGEVSRQIFLQHALSKLEAGMQAHTLVAENRLICSAWTRLQEQPHDDAPSLLLITDIYTADGYAQDIQGLLGRILHHYERVDGDSVILRTPHADGQILELLARIGFEPSGEYSPVTDQPDKKT